MMHRFLVPINVEEGSQPDIQVIKDLSGPHIQVNKDVNVSLDIIKNGNSHSKQQADRE